MRIARSRLPSAVRALRSDRAPKEGFELRRDLLRLFLWTMIAVVALGVFALALAALLAGAVG